MAEVRLSQQRLPSPASRLSRLSLCAVLIALTAAPACRHIRPRATHDNPAPPVIDGGGSTPANPPAISRLTFRLLSDGSLHRQEPPPSNAFYVALRMEGDRFVAQGEVLGEGAFAGDGHPGWMELADGSFHGDQTARAPARPYVHGVRNADGFFQPDSRTVVH